MKKSTAEVGRQPRKPRVEISTQHGSESPTGLLLSPFDKVREALPHLPRKQLQLATALLETPETFAFGSVRVLASLFHVNNITIIRFAQALGYSGYQALQAAVRQAYLQRAGMQPPRDATVVLSDPDGALAATLAQHQTNLELARARLAEPELNRVCDVLIAARRILVCASGSATVVGTLLVRLLRHVGLRGELIAVADVDRTIALYDVGPDDVVVGIGLWLTFRAVVECMDLARRLGAQTVALTGSSASPLAAVTDHLLIAPAQGAALPFSVVASVAVVEALVAHIAGQRAEQVATIEQTLHDLYVKEGLLAPQTGQSKTTS